VGGAFQCEVLTFTNQRKKIVGFYRRAWSKRLIKLRRLDEFLTLRGVTLKIQTEIITMGNSPPFDLAFKTFQDNQFVSSISEPSEWMLMLIGLGLVGRFAAAARSSSTRSKGSQIQA
jgi:hypothetical protein